MEINNLKLEIINFKMRIMTNIINNDYFEIDYSLINLTLKLKRYRLLSHPKQSIKKQSKFEKVGKSIVRIMPFRVNELNS